MEEASRFRGRQSRVLRVELSRQKKGGNRNDHRHAAGTRTGRTSYRARVKAKDLVTGQWVGVCGEWTKDDKTAKREERQLLTAGMPGRSHRHETSPWSGTCGRNGFRS
jgi:hypothetical protein